MIVLLLMMPFLAHAYLDLGSGSYLIQMLLALAFAIPLSMKAFWHRIFSFFRRSKPAEKSEEISHSHEKQ
ncbi:MAG: hypothetical protein AAB604_02170 [Patescibacteria group bacterium]|jgi:hypothetical protein